MLNELFIKALYGIFIFKRLPPIKCVFIRMSVLFKGMSMACLHSIPMAYYAVSPISSPVKQFLEHEPVCEIGTYVLSYCSSKT